MKKKTEKIAIGTAVAAEVGYLAGILTAPKTGKSLRKTIHNTASKTRSETERKLKSMHSEVNDLIVTGNETRDKLQDKTDEKLAALLVTANTAKDKAREMISALHEGGAADEELQVAVNDVNKAIRHLKKYLTNDTKTKKTSK